MLKLFSWTHFLVLYASLSALWYFGVYLISFRKGRFPGDGHRPGPLVAFQDSENSGQGYETEVPELMGKARLPEGLEVLSMSSISFSVGEEDSRAEQIGLVADVLEEIKEIFAVLAKEDGSKQDFFAMAGMISEKYGRIGSSPNIGRINEYIREHAPFAITLEELENLWD